MNKKKKKRKKNQNIFISFFYFLMRLFLINDLSIKNLDFLYTNLLPLIFALMLLKLRKNIYPDLFSERKLSKLTVQRKLP